MFLKLYQSDQQVVSYKLSEQSDVRFERRKVDKKANLHEN